MPDLDFLLKHDESFRENFGVNMRQFRLLHRWTQEDLGIVGVIGMGRAAYKFASGDTDAVTSLVMGIIALFIGALCATFV